MRYLSFLFVFLSFVQGNLYSQVLKSESDTLKLLEEIPFPEASANMIFGFNKSMLNLKALPSKSGPKKDIDKLLKNFESDKKDITNLMDIYYYYHGINEDSKGYRYLEQAYGYAMELYEMNPSNIENVEHIEKMLQAVNRIPDIPMLWVDYTKSNPLVAKGWVNLALAQIQNLDTTACRKSLEKAFELEPESPQLYVAALSDVIYRLILKMQSEGENAVVIADMGFFDKALSLKSNNEQIKTAHQIARVFELFYAIIFNNANNDNESGFKFELTEKQQIELVELEKSFKKQIDNKKIVNKFILYKSLLVLEVLKMNPEKGEKYFNEAVKIIDNDADLYRMLSFSNIIIKNFKKASGYLKKSVEISPNFEDRFALARIYFQDNQYQQSRELLEQLIRENPGKINIVMAYISVLFKERKFEDACTMLFRVESMYKEDTDFGKNEYFLFHKAICTILYSKEKEELRAALQDVIDKKLPWSSEAENLLKKFL